MTIRNLQTLLRNYGVWVKKDKQVTIARSLYNTLCKEDQTEWTKEQILDDVEFNRSFASFKLNRIASLIPNLLNQIRPINPSDFGINLMDQSTPKQAVNSTPHYHNGPDMTSVYDLPFNSKVLIYKSSN